MAEAASTSDSTRSVLRQDILLTTKLHVPLVRPNLVARPHLVELVDQELSSRLTLISAPAGSGKTTLLAEWIASRKPSVAWLSLDIGDNDPARFWAYVILALQGIHDELGESALAALRSPQLRTVEAIPAVLVDEISGLPITGHPFVLVLDDYHVIENTRIHESLAFLLDNLPSQLRLVVSTRADPPLPLARYRARGQLVEVYADNLRFTPDETATLLNRVMGLNLSVGDIAALADRTEGWAVGLQMAALAIQGPLSIQGRRAEHISDFVRAFSGSHHYVLDYLVEEVFNHQPASVQTFLLHTSILERLSGPLCDAVTEQTDSQAMLERLEKANLFLTPLDDERRWYRYHHLFADLLRARLQQSQRGQATTLHIRAAEWYEKNEWVVEAVGHALEARDYERAARLVEQNAIALISRGQLTTVLNWGKAIPADVAQRRPGLCVQQAWALTFASELDSVEPRLQAIEQQIQPDATAPETRDVLGSIALIRALMADLHGDLPRAIELAQLADTLLLKTNLTTRSIIPFILGRAYRAQGDLAKAEAALGEIVKIGQAVDNLWTISVGMCELAALRRIQGKLREATDLYSQVQQLATERGCRQFGSLAGADVGMSTVLLEQDQLDEARRCAEDGLKHMLGWQSPNDLTMAHTTLARVLLAQGDLERADAILQQAEDIKHKSHVFPYYGILVDTCRVRLWLAQSNLADAARWANEKACDESNSPVMHEYAQIMVARVFIAESRFDQAASLLARLAASAEAGGRIGRLIEILALEAVAFQMQRDTPRALVTLEKALLLAMPEGYVRVFVDAGEPVRQLLEKIKAKGGGMVAYATKLLAADGGERLQSSAFIPQPLAEPLSERELQVLRLVADGLSNREIADKLFISIRTVKKHVENIHGKLGAKSRTQAVAQARELKLL